MPLPTDLDVETIKTPHGIRYANTDGELGILSGRVETRPFVAAPPQNWTQRVHPFRNIWVNDELKQRASFIATRQHLSPFIIQHRFEGKVNPTQLRRSKLGYGIGLNKAYLHEVFGHLRSTPAHYTWGSLGTADPETLDPPRGGLAERMWFDATGDGVGWTAFFEGRVLEWMLTAPGGFVLVDSNRLSPGPLSQREAERLGIRTSFKFIPYSWVEDFSRGPKGYRWVKFAETEDRRRPDMGVNETGFEKRHILYELIEGNGITRISRWDDDANPIGPLVFQNVRDTDGRGILPLVEVKFGEHPDLSFLGTGLLMGLDDIVIDMFNLVSEVREAYREAVFSFLKYTGDSAEEVKDQLQEGSRFVHIGDSPQSSLQREAADSNEVEAGLRLFEVGLKNWSLSAKRRAIEIMEASSARSAVSLKAEFQLDLKPLLVNVTEVLDQVETTAMFIWAQLEGLGVEQANTLMVRRETEFQMEQEASRIARIISEFMSAGAGGLPAVVLKKLYIRWAQSLGVIDFEERVDGVGTIGELIERQAEELAEAAMTSQIRQSQFANEFDTGQGAQ